MQSSSDAIAHAVATAKVMGRRFCEDLTADELLHRPVGKANCAAWTLGHLAIANRTAAGKLGATDLPPLPEGFEKRFSRDEGCPQANQFGDTGQLLTVFEQSCDALINAVKRATPEQLNKPTDRQTPMFKTAGELANFMALHAAMHIGQITTIRRSLGRPPLI